VAFSRVGCHSWKAACNITNVNQVPVGKGARCAAAISVLTKARFSLDDAAKLRAHDAALAAKKGTINITRRRRDAEATMSMIQLPTSLSYKIDDLFTRLDTDGNGVLSANDFQQQQFGEASGLGMAQWTELKKRADIDSDGCITRSEFTAAILMYAVDVEREALEEACGRTLPLDTIVNNVQRDVVSKVEKLVKAFDKTYNPAFVEEPSCVIC